jgi:hypothetical protein
MKFSNLGKPFGSLESAMHKMHVSLPRIHVEQMFKHHHEEKLRTLLSTDLLPLSKHDLSIHHLKDNKTMIVLHHNLEKIEHIVAKLRFLLQQHPDIKTASHSTLLFVDSRLLLQTLKN